MHVHLQAISAAEGAAAAAEGEAALMGSLAALTPEQLAAMAGMGAGFPMAGVVEADGRPAKRPRGSES